MYPSNAHADPEKPPDDTPPWSKETTQRKTAPRGAFAEAALAEATRAKGPHSPSEWRECDLHDNDVYFPSDKSQKAQNRPNSKTPGSAGLKCNGATALLPARSFAETGPTAVEQVAVGDRVFCCDPETGCLALKSVPKNSPSRGQAFEDPCGWG